MRNLLDISNTVFLTKFLPFNHTLIKPVTLHGYRASSTSQVSLPDNFEIQVINLLDL